MANKELKDDFGVDLDAFFDAGRRPEPVPGPLVGRIMADAASAQAAQPRGILSRLVGAIGGWASVAGLASAALGGVWIGFAAPSTFEMISYGSDYTVSDFLPTVEAAFGN